MLEPLVIKSPKAFLENSKGHPTQRAADLAVCAAKKRILNEEFFPFRELVLPPSR